MSNSKGSGPGVYINETNEFPNSLVPVATAVPAFIGYTPIAMYKGKSYLYLPQKISSFAEFKSIYCFPDPAPPAGSAKQYTPQYYVVKQESKPENGDHFLIADSNYSILPDPNTIYYLFNSIKLFYQNGGGDAYIVSVGSYGVPSNCPLNPGDPIVNPNIHLDDLTKGIKLLSNEQEPTMYICPEATLLGEDDNATLMQQMLIQCSQRRSAISIFDIKGGKTPDPISFEEDIFRFRANTGNQGLDFGTAYYPFVGASIMGAEDIDYTNLFGGDTKQLEELLKNADNHPDIISSIFLNINIPTSGLSVSQNNKALLVASPTYKLIMDKILRDVNLLPASGGMAGVISMTDNQVGVWQAPANTSILSVISLPIHLTETQQMNLNVDAVSGKSINAIRNFNGLGILVWGARTLDGNSQDWRYLSVRRTMIFLEQSCKLATEAYMFSPNDINTWQAVKAMLSAFLTSVWKEGGLQGASASDSFSVECGLGTTMTSEDILNGFMNISVRVAVVRPAEFLILGFKQQMAISN